MAFTPSQQKALSIIPHFTGFFSFIGSSWIIYEVLKDRRKWNRTYHRLMFAISTFDLFQSVANGLSTIPIPKGTTGVYDPMGNTATCTAQGFFVQLGLTSSFYNGMLSIYYVLLIRVSMPEKRISARIEPLMHATCLIVNFGFAFTALGLELYNNANLWCWIGTLPGNCQGSSGEAGPVDCDRGYNAWIYRWAFFFAPLWFIMVLSSYLMFLLYRSVKNQEKRSNKFRYASLQRRLSLAEKKNQKRQKRKYERSKKVASQAMFYVGAFYMTWAFGTANRLQQLIHNEPIFGLMLMHSIFVPMQGAFNFVVYLRPRFIRWNKKRKKQDELKAREKSRRRIELDKHGRGETDGTEETNPTGRTDDNADDNGAGGGENKTSGEASGGNSGAAATTAANANATNTSSSRTRADSRFRRTILNSSIKRFIEKLNSGSLRDMEELYGEDSKDSNFESDYWARLRLSEYNDYESSKFERDYECMSDDDSDGDDEDNDDNDIGDYDDDDSVDDVEKREEMKEMPNNNESPSSPSSSSPQLQKQKNNQCDTTDTNGNEPPPIIIPKPTSSLKQSTTTKKNKRVSIGTFDVIPQNDSKTIIA